MKSLFAFICFFALINFGIHSQSTSLKPSDLVAKAISSNTKQNFTVFSVSSDRSNVRIPKEIESYSLLNVNKSQVNALEATNAGLVTLSIPQEGRADIALELVEVHPFAADFSVKIAPTMETVKVNTGKHYRGIIKGQKSSVAAVSVINGEIIGFISHPMAKGNLVIGKLENDTRHILYQDDQISSLFSFDCQAKDNTVQYTKEQLRGSSDGSARALSDCVRLYLEVDHDIYLNKGSSVPNVTSFVTGLFNQVSTLYANEQINTVVSEIVVWTVPSPYNGTTSIAMLNAFTAYRQGFNGDLAQLLSYKASGGVAYVDGLCRSNPDYSMSYAGIQSTYQNVPTYSWSVEVCTHEFGHLFGSQHTHACVWNGNNTAIDGCYTTEGGCPNPGLPSGGGTIMSYCHLTNAGINFSNGFGTQPGNIIRSEVTGAACLQACEGDGGGNGGGNECQENVLILNVRTDSYANETTWNIKNSSGTIIYSGGPYSNPNSINTHELCLPTGCYTFSIYDSYGDGICCAYGPGYYNIMQGTTTLISGGQFGTSEIKSFCASGSSNPTCTDGIQNGNETGVDCGGNCPACPTCTDGIQNGNESGVDCGGNCPACPTCTDGVQNGSETGVDCGGNCPACPTCNDGIQNGGETGVDCGGNCPACPTGSIQITNIAGHYFETGWDGWTSGGSDCARYGGSLAPEGTYAIRIRDNSGVPSAMTSAVYNVATYDSVTVQFKFIASSFESVEDFWLMYYNGTSWSTIKSFVLNTDFVNNQVYTKTIKINGPLSSNAQFRFQADASDDTDVVYIDAVVIKGYKTVGGSNPTCNDGIQNGNETGVDCGGNCPACPTCTDGIQNGGETGVDCGGNCPACPTCNDGIQNGNETGVDCGGNCPACPTCNDGIQNGNETGVDCGGNCPACPTCNDGIQNGSETGVDCGGNCPACPTCNDGVQNGSETGVDCGGNCPACPTGNIQITTLAGHYFETGWDGWTGGGSDCARYGGSQSPEGTYSIRIRDNSGVVSAMTSPTFNLTTYDSVTIEFKFKPVSFETGEDFWLRYYNGTSWSTIKTFVVNTDFVNNQVYTKTVKISSPLSSNAQFRFQADASDDTDIAYIDAVVIRGYKTTGAPAPSCNDGIQNGNETGIDCGGSCTACPTCSDGIQNGNETGVDCGGNCPACPTCSDGVQNGNETGVDCGGNCSACPTCSDGVKNGNETGIDCGGSCAACPTCTDGIQNGNETGVDCGGNCPACPTNGNTEITTIAGHYFESGWDGWLGGGADCARYGGSRSPEGIYSIRLRDNNGEISSMTSAEYNLVTYDSVTVEFKFNTISFETGKDFWVRYYNGSTWTTVASYVFNTDFINNQVYTKTIKINGPLSTNAKFRFQSDAGDATDLLYIDAVIIKGYKTVPVGLLAGQDETKQFLARHYFETGWDGWTDGGGDCFRYKGNMSAEGQYSIRLRNHSSEASTMTSESFDLSTFRGAEIKFQFRANQMEKGEHLRLEYFNGDSWYEAATFTSGDHFINEDLYAATVILSGPFGNDVKFRFQSNASDKDDNIFIDAVIVSGIQDNNQSNNSVTVTKTDDFKLVKSRDLSNNIRIYPNPGAYYVNVATDEKISIIKVYTLAGQLVLTENVNESNVKLDITSLNVGMYLIHVETDENVYIEKIVKQ